jgi:hypothetical protein
MNWSVIYEFELHERHRDWVDRYTPRRGEWELTEEDDQFEGYEDVTEGVHRKYCGFLTDKEFREFVNDVLYAYHVENTGGMIGAPLDNRMSLGRLPAWSLSPDGDPYAFWMDAYVCPINENDDETRFLLGMTEEQIRVWIKTEYIE